MEEDQLIGKSKSLLTEKAILGTILTFQDTVVDVLSKLSPDAFFDTKNRMIFEAICKLNNDNIPVDIISVATLLKNNKQLENCGNYIYLSELTNQAALGLGRIDYYCKILIQLQVERSLVDMCAEIINRSDGSNDVADTLSYADRQLQKINEILTCNNRMEHVSLSIDKAVDESVIRTENRKEGRMTGVTSGLRELDKMTSGFKGGDLIILAARPAMGKALRMDAKILTPDGWKLNKDLVIGDKVCSIDGTDSFVTGIFPQGFVKTYSVSFSDGRTIECCGSHLWSVESCKFHRNARRVLSTLEIKELIETERYKNRISIPAFSGIFGDRKDFVIHPYLLGVLLGDGVLSKGICWSKPEDFIKDKISEIVDYPIRQNGDVFIVSNTENIFKNKYLSELKKIGLHGKHSYEKFIPDSYLDCCREQRIELLNGLLDTDGDVDKNGSICYNTTSERLAKDTQKLCWSLGYKCSMSRKQGKLYGVEKRMSYRLFIVPSNPYECFSLPRKKERCKERKSRPLTIVDIKPTGKHVECQCISVSHKESLYITDDYIVTHNTAMLLYFAKSAARQGIPVCIYSLEMDSISLADRLILSETSIDANKYRNGYISNSDFNEIALAKKNLSELPIYVDDNPIVSMRYIRAHSKRMSKQGKCGLILVDYLQLADMGERGKNREQEVAQASRQAKIIAKELNVPFILLSQLNRACEERMDKKPQLSDLRESGAIEQDADKVLFVYRPEYYKLKDQSGNPIIGEGALIMAKQRNGGVGEVKFRYNESLTQIRDYDDVFFDANPF